MHNHDKHADHDHEQEHEEHQHSGNPVIDWFRHTFTPHDHGYQTAALDAALATERGIQAVKVSLVALLLTAAFQMVIVAISGSVALLADTIHNFSDALTAIPLGIAFTLSRRSRNSRYTYGYGRAEDIAGVIIVLMILFSAFQAIYQSILKLMDPEPISNIAWVAGAAVVGFMGNELVAIYRIRTASKLARPHSSRTAITPAPMGLPRWPSWRAPSAYGWAIPCSIRWWGWESALQFWSSSGTLPKTCTIV
jgi:Co/Zn/Cd efflux system component